MTEVALVRIVVAPSEYLAAIEIEHDAGPETRDDVLDVASLVSLVPVFGACLMGT